MHGRAAARSMMGLRYLCDEYVHAGRAAAATTPQRRGMVRIGERSPQLHHAAPQHHGQGARLELEILIRARFSPAEQNIIRSEINAWLEDNPTKTWHLVHTLARKRKAHHDVRRREDTKQ